MEEYNKTAAQIQAKQTQMAASDMQSYRKIAEEKRAEADDAYRVKMNLTPEQYIQLRSVEIEKEKVDMVRNKRNVSINMLMGNGAQPFYNIK
jgi:predicted HAD superfamily hydrolase